MTPKEISARRIHAVELRVKGLKFREIGVVLGVSTGRAWEIFQAGALRVDRAIKAQEDKS